MDNIIESKSFDFAIRIVNLYKTCLTERKKIFFQSSCFAVEQASVQMLPKPSKHRANQISFRR